MITLLRSLLGAARSFLRTQRDLAIENLALRHQIDYGVAPQSRTNLSLGPKGRWNGRYGASQQARQRAVGIDFHGGDQVVRSHVCRAAALGSCADALGMGCGPGAQQAC